MRSMTSKRPQIAVVGGADCAPETAQAAFEVGRLLGRNGAVLLCGGRGGVMERAAAGARSEGGLTVGILPGTGPAETPPSAAIELDLYTGIGQARNLVLVLSARAVIAIGGGWGTLSEIALALKHGRPVVCLGSWRLERPDGAAEELLFESASPVEAVDRALALAAATNEAVAR